MDELKNNMPVNRQSYLPKKIDPTQKLIPCVFLVLGSFPLANSMEKNPTKSSKNDQIKM